MRANELNDEYDNNNNSLLAIVVLYGIFALGRKCFDETKKSHVYINSIV